jgi:HSP20 family molecular chaperone IbpA
LTLIEKYPNFQQLRDHSAQLKIEDNGDLSYKVHVSGCRQEDLNVELQGKKIIVRGEYEEQIGSKHDVIFLYGVRRHWAELLGKQEFGTTSTFVDEIKI